ncbi:MAG: phosphatase PAP2 family protein, partial [Planctomycetaceae bacterium]
MTRPANAARQAAPNHSRRHVAARRRIGRLERLEPRQLMAADVVMQWNNSALDAIRATNTPPPIAARSLAMVHAAIFDAVNSITQTYSAYEFDFVAPPTASQEAAVSAAAQRVLTNLFPAQATLFAGLTSAILATVPDGRNEDAGVHVGQLAADAVLAVRVADGADATVDYQPGTNLGQWQTTLPGHAAALLPQWADVAPFVLTTADQFSGALGASQIPALDSPEYAAAFDEVKALGSVNSTTRTTEQTEIAQFWANGAGTATPPGHLNVMAQIIAQPRKLTIEQQAKLFAQLNLALADTAIAVWDLKYDTDYWRPITAIHSADTDGNDATQADATWQPLITTPPFPTYVSGHSAFSAAAAEVMKNFFGTDAISLTLPSESSSASDRSFTSLSQAAEESAVSRLYGGVHWAFDNRDGLELGAAIGSYVSAQTLSVATSPAAIGVYDGVLV